MNKNNPTLDELFLLFSRGELTGNDLERLLDWSAGTESGDRILELLEGKSPYGKALKQMYAYDQERVWKPIRKKMQRKYRMHLLRRAATVAAAAIVTAALTWTGARFLPVDPDAPEQNRITTIVKPGKTGAVLEVSTGEALALDGREEGHTLKTADNAIHVEEGSARFVPETAPAARETLSVNTVRVPRGGEYRLTLCEGTQVWLNAESSITFPTRFDGKERRVTASGEVYFEVAHDPGHPFVVEIDRATLTVLGTSFNVYSYPTTGQTEITLTEGSLKTTARESGEETTLRPGMQTTVDDTGHLSSREVRTEFLTAWRHGMFVFFEEPVVLICQKLARWYDIEIAADPDKLGDIRFTGIIKRQETFNKVAELLASTDEIYFTEQDGRFEVHARK